jgi:uncharacterized protein (TIGR03643 family)
MKNTLTLSIKEIDRIVEMAWEDRTPFEAIESQFLISESEVINLMRKSLKESAFKMWRKRMKGRKTKHFHKRANEITTFKSRMQRGITFNKISKR